MKNINLVGIIFIAIVFFGCSADHSKTIANESADTALAPGETNPENEFVYVTEQFADVQILRYQVPGFNELDIKLKELVYYLFQAAESGRDIIYDQNYKHNLYIRRTLENIVQTYSGDRENDEFKKFMVYTKKVWFSNGIHHHYSTKKLLPDFSIDYFKVLVNSSNKGGFPLQKGESTDDLIEKFNEIMFDHSVDSKRVNQDPNADPVAESANNYYDRVKMREAEEFYRNVSDKNNPRPVSYGLNSKLVAGPDGLKEVVWKVGGMYSAAIEKIVYWLKKASQVAENEKQKKALDLLIVYYETGDLKKFDEYNIAWVEDTASIVDVVNGFIEVYGDAIGYRGAFESVVSIKDIEATKRIKAISDVAQWFEDNSPILDKNKKKNVVGISAKVITVVTESGDASPSTPIGINLPNANWIRAEFGSKSVNLGNIVHAYSQAKKSGGMLKEFAFSQEEIDRVKKYALLADNLHTDMHEVIGHASGQINSGIGTPKETLKSYASALEEGRADLVALYYLMDKKLIDIGVMPTTDVGRAAYDSYIRNGLMTQLVRLEKGDDLEESHMRNRQLIAKWAFEKGMEHKWWKFWEKDVIDKVKKEGKTYFVIKDYEKLRNLFGQLLCELQRITSEGDYEAGKNLIETYGVKVDAELHTEVLERYSKLNMAPYSGFINPILIPMMKGDEIIDVKIEYPDDFTEQMLFYAKEYSFLPTYN